METNKWRQQFPVLVQMICTSVRNHWYDALRKTYGDDYTYQWWLEQETTYMPF